MPLAQKDESDGGIDRDNVGKNFVVDSFDSRDVCRGRKSYYVLKWREKKGRRRRYLQKTLNTLETGVRQ